MTPIAYYAPENPCSSFHVVAREHVRVLRDAGFDVRVSPLSGPVHAVSGNVDRTRIAVVNTLLYGADSDQAIARRAAVLSSRHEHVLGFEVADTTAVSPTFAAAANHPVVDRILVPSTFSQRSLVDSGVTKAVDVVPYGVRRWKASDTFAGLHKDPRLKVLCFQMRMPWRKGGDLVARLIDRFEDVLFVIKGPRCSGRRDPSNVCRIDAWLEPADLAGLYRACDALVSLHRGGAFELNCLEALAYGLPVIATGAGAVLEYLDPETAHLVAIADQAPLYPAGNLHCGHGFTPDVDDAAASLRRVLAQLPEEKEKVGAAGEKLAHRYTWERVLEPFLNRLSELASTPG